MTAVAPFSVQPCPTSAGNTCLAASLPAFWPDLTLLIHAPTDGYNRSPNFVSDGKRTAEEREGEEDTPPAGNHDGRVIGLAGDDRGSQSESPRALAGAGDDSYAGYDPGMAGCTTEPSTCHIPGVPWMGRPPPASPSYLRAPAHPYTASRGYERDEEEYAASFTSEAQSWTDLATGGAEPGPGLATATESAVDPNPATELAQATDPAAEPPTADPEPEQPHTPSIGSRIVGRVERLAGKVLRDSDIQARGKRHMVRVDLVASVLAQRSNSERC